MKKSRFAGRYVRVSMTIETAGHLIRSVANDIYYYDALCDEERQALSDLTGRIEKAIEKHGIFHPKFLSGLVQRRHNELGDSPK